MSELEQIPLNIDLPIQRPDCIYHDQTIVDGCDLYGTANCAKCKNYVRK